MLSKLLSRAFVALAAFPAAAFALGLGDIRLNSSLNAPLDAEIELIGATEDELRSLRPEIASRETFTRYGLDWPSFLGSVTLRQTRTPDGREVIRLRSTEALTEPFLTFLVEVNWARGRLVREYTMLLDPPVYTPGTRPSDSVPVAAPSVGDTTRQGAIERAPQQPADAAPSRARVPSDDVAVPATAGDSYEVVRGDTLSGLSRRLASGDQTAARQWMLAVYQANPQAFVDGNMNHMRSGAVLRIPDQASIAAVSPDAANAEVRRQYAAWRGSAAGAAAGAQGRLRLVTPTDPGTGASDSRASQAEVETLQGQVRDLETQLTESRRLLELRNAELAQLQTRLAAAAEAEAPAEESAAPADESAAPAEEPLVADTETPADSEVPVEPTVADTSADETLAEPVVAEPAPADSTAPTPVEAEDSGGSLLDTITGLWWVIALALLAVLAVFGLRMWRSRKESEFDDSLGRLASAGADSLAREPSIAPSSMRQSPMAASGPREQAAFLVEESGTHEQPRFEEKPRAAAPAARAISSDDTISSETAINLDQGDPLAEADFHMAYGLYDQAADLVRMSIAREPERRDLKLKLLEVFFVWGNKDQFLQTARELAESRGRAVPGEWEKIVIMGKQLAPEDALFSGMAGVSGAAAGGVDLDLEGGQNRVDFDVLGEPVSPQAEGVDLDFNAAFGDRDPTGQPRTVAMDMGGDTQEQGGIGSATTRQMTAKMQRESEGFSADFDSGDSSPTAEQPGPYSQDGTVRQKLESALKRESGQDHTAELNIDDLGLDLGSFDTMDNPALSTTQETPTLVAGLDDRSRNIMEEADLRGSADDESTSTSPTGSWEIGSQDATLPPSSVRALDSGASTSNDPTTAMPRGGIDFDIGEIDSPQPSSNGQGIDLDVGPAMQADTGFTATQKLAPDDLALPDLEPVTMSEVGTKLDLARAYMDMGDPEGARNILEEVLHEGSVAQKQEAQRLIESLPG